jgi:PucR C-terminal helix-turn-helix domain/GGDEF-like domain
VDSRAQQILSRFEARADEIADEIAQSTVAEVDGFAPINDPRLSAEIRTLARRHLDGYLATARSGGSPAPAVLAAARERATLRAREMVPLAALVHSYLIAQRVISAAIAREADTDAQSRDTALALIARTFDYNIAVTAAMAEAYVDVVQGELAELDAARRGLVDALLTSEAEALPALTRRAIGLGFDPDHEYVVVLGVVDIPEERDAVTGSPRWASQAVARSSGRPERNAFVVSRERDLLAALDANGGHPPRLVLERAASTIKQAHGALLRAGIGTPFTGLVGFSASYQEARRALKHVSDRRPFVFGPDDVLLFDELTATGSDDDARLIPEATRRVLADDALRATVEAFFEADLNVATAAKSLTLHPNTLRYRLSRIKELTGRDPRKLTDLLELITSTRLITSTAGD